MADEASHLHMSRQEKELHFGQNDLFVSPLAYLSLRRFELFQFHSSFYKAIKFRISLMMILCLYPN